MCAHPSIIKTIVPNRQKYDYKSVGLLWRMRRYVNCCMSRKSFPIFWVYTIHTNGKDFLHKWYLLSVDLDLESLIDEAGTPVPAPAASVNPGPPTLRSYPPVIFSIENEKYTIFFMHYYFFFSWRTEKIEPIASLLIVLWFDPTSDFKGSLANSKVR